YFNHGHDKRRALDAFDRALQADSNDGRILYERDQLWKRIGEAPARRLEELLRFPALIESRDDLSVELATLYNQVGQREEALELLLRRQFQPWEGGEGLVLAQYVRARLLLGWQALGRGDFDEASCQFQAALETPHNLSEARHLLANQSDVYYWAGIALEKQGKAVEARKWWLRATRFKGDFQQMMVKNISDMTYWSALAHQCLGESSQAQGLLHQIYQYSLELEAIEPKIDYFATSLPAMLLFEEDLRRRNAIEARYLRAQSYAGLGKIQEAELLLQEVLTMDASHAGASDLLQQIHMP